MNADKGIGRPALLLAAVLALLLTAVPLPRGVEPLRPDFVALLVLWLCVMAPRSAGLLFAFLVGLALDAFKGVVLGQNAFALVTIAYLAMRFHLRIRVFPPGHQMLTVLSLLWLHQFLLFWIDGVTGHALTDGWRWLPVVTGALAWVPLSGVYARLLARR